MNVLVFEFITGGGYAQDELPESLANEGLLMLKALINDLVILPSVQLTILLDWRFKQTKFPDNINIVMVSKGQCIYEILPALVENSNLVWPIAPEMDLILQRLSVMFENQAKRLLNSTSDAVTICSNKLTTFQALKHTGTPVIETMQLDAFSPETAGKWVIKPKDGVGCLNSNLITNKNEFIQINKQIEDKYNYVIQPYIEGDSLSLSCLFKDGKSWLLCCNRQQVSIKQGQFGLRACEVNIPIKDLEVYQYLINKIADSITGLWGYVGIDIIQPKQESPIILEINPRLTTSFVGIHQALGFNVAKAVIEMIDATPVINKSQNNKIIVDIQQ